MGTDTSGVTPNGSSEIPQEAAHEQGYIEAGTMGGDKRQEWLFFFLWLIGILGDIDQRDIRRDELHCGKLGSLEGAHICWPVEA